MEKQNLYKVLNEFNMFFGEEPISITVDFVANHFVYLKMLYDEHVDIPANGISYSWNQFDNSGQNCAMIKLLVGRDDKTNLPKFTLFKDTGIYVNPHIMPDEEKANRFHNAVLKWSGDNWEERIFGTYNVTLSNKLLKMCINVAEKALRQEKRIIANETDLQVLKNSLNHLSSTIDILQILQDEYALQNKKHDKE